MNPSVTAGTDRIEPPTLSVCRTPNLPPDRAAASIALPEPT